MQNFGKYSGNEKYSDRDNAFEEYDRPINAKDIDVLRSIGKTLDDDTRHHSGGNRINVV